MIRNSKWNLIVAFVAVVVFTAPFSTEVSAWGPYAQAVIAKIAVTEASLQQEPLPPEMHWDLFISESTASKGWEYESIAYAKETPEFSTVMFDRVGDRQGRCQAFAWGCSQAVETAGDNLYFFPAAKTPQERFLREIAADACFHSGNVEETNLANFLKTVNVAVRSKVLEGTSKEFTDVYGGTPFRESVARTEAYTMALSMLGEKVLVINTVFQDNAADFVQLGQIKAAYHASKDALVEYAQSQSAPASLPPTWFGGPAAPYGQDVLARLGREIIAGGFGNIGVQNNGGTMVYTVNLGQVSEATAVAEEFLVETAHNQNENPIVREIAGTLLEWMPESILP